jgi:hypothetical protein
MWVANARIWMSYLSQFQWRIGILPVRDNLFSIVLLTYSVQATYRIDCLRWRYGRVFASIFLSAHFSCPGHRLKSANNKTSKMFGALRTPRRVILSGTPIQNELSEFHAMVCHNSIHQPSPTEQVRHEGGFLQSWITWYVSLCPLGHHADDIDRRKTTTVHSKDCTRHLSFEVVLRNAPPTMQKLGKLALHR